MASVQANPEMPGQGQLPGNITREQIQHVFQVSTRTDALVPLVNAHLTKFPSATLP